MRSYNGPRWSVDLLATTEIHLVRIITDVVFKPADLKGLQIIVGKTITGNNTEIHVAELMGVESQTRSHKHVYVLSLTRV